jgi:hypothetical protein
MADTRNRYSIVDAQEIIRDIAQNGSIVTSRHTDFDHPERGYTTDDIEHILKNGVITKEPEYDQKRQDWKYRVEGKDIDNDNAVAITVIVSHRELWVVTVFPA